jgi:hypothetical protein
VIDVVFFSARQGSDFSKLNEKNYCREDFIQSVDSREKQDEFEYLTGHKKIMVT